MAAMSHISRPLLGCALALGLAIPAFARQPPTPPPSGIVIHLFGPNSITSNILPTTPGSPGPSGSGTAAGGSGTAANGATDSPSWSSIAHQMFVTGDPAQEGANALPKGRAGGK